MSDGAGHGGTCRLELRRPVGRIEAPCLIIAGRHDIHTSWQQSARIARRVPHAQLVILEESGHFPWLEESVRFFEVVETWLAETTAP